jgi:hypothetical protein
MVAKDNWLLRQDLLYGGFQSFGDFHWLAAELPLPGWAASPSPSPSAEETRESDHV